MERTPRNDVIRPRDPQQQQQQRVENSPTKTVKQAHTQEAMVANPVTNSSHVGRKVTRPAAVRLNRSRDNSSPRAVDDVTATAAAAAAAPDHDSNIRTTRGQSQKMLQNIRLRSAAREIAISR